MKSFFIVLLIMGFPLLASGTTLIDSDKILDQQDCFSGSFVNYPSWRKAMESKHKRRLKTEGEVTQAMKRFDSLFGEQKFKEYKNQLACVTFSYTVDGNAVRGYAISPKNMAHSKLPVLVYNRGGNGNFGGVVFGKMMLDLFPLSIQGFVVNGSQYRGTFSSDSKLQDEFGGSDVKDVTELLSYIPKVRGADQNRIGMFGSSRGGMQTFLVLKESKDIKAIAVIASPTDLFKGLVKRPEMENVYKSKIPNYDKNKTEELKKRSVIKWVAELPKNVPILLLHGDNDKRVSVDHSIELAKELEMYKIPHKLVLYPDDNHGLFNNKSKAQKELVNWFSQNL